MNKKNLIKKSQKIVKRVARQLNFEDISICSFQEGERTFEHLQEITDFAMCIFPALVGKKRYSKLCKEAMKGNPITCFMPNLAGLGNGNDFNFSVHVWEKENIRNGELVEPLKEGVVRVEKDSNSQFNNGNNRIPHWN